VISSFTISNAFIDDAGGRWLNSSAASDGGNATGTAVIGFDALDTAISDAGVQILNAKTGLLIASAPMGGAATAFVPFSLADGIYSLQANASDVWGNPVFSTGLIPVTTSPGVDTLTLGVKTSQPTCTILGPIGYWNVLKNGGPAPGNVTLPVQIASSNAGATDLTGQPIPGTASVSVNGAVAASTAINSPNFTAPVTAPQGAVALLASVFDPAGNPPGTCPGTLTVDTVPPTITVTPTNPDSVVAGIPTYTSSNNVPIAITTDAPAGQTISVFVAGDGGVTNLWNTVVGTGGSTATTLAAIPQGLSTLTASVTDLAGNVGATASGVAVDVEAPGFCSVFIASPPAGQIIGAGSGSDAGPGAVLVDFVVETLDTSCFGNSVTFTLTPSSGGPIVTTLPLDTTGKAHFPTALTDGEIGSYSASINDGKGSATPSFPFEVKLGPPTISGVGISPSAAALEIVAFSGNPLVGTTLDGGALVVANGAADVANAHATFQVVATGLGPLVSGNFGTASLHLDFPLMTTTDPPVITLATDPATVSFVDVLMPPHAAGGTVTLTVNDNATNSVSHAWSIDTDVIAPGVPGVTATVTNAHAATLSLAWNAPGDDGAGGGPVVAYDLRWSTTLNPNNDNEFFDGGMTVTNTGLAGSPIGTGQSYALTVPPLNQYFVALRAVDAVGNRSALVVNTIPDPWKTATLTAPNPNGDTAFGWRVESGDFNGDGATDLVISDPFYGGAGAGDTADGGLIYILSGQNDPDLTKLSLSNAAVLFSGATSDRFGYDLTVGDFNADGTDDLAVGAYPFNSNQGLVNIYFGGSGIANGAAPDVTITGASGATAQFGRTVRTLKGVGPSGDALFIGEPGALGGATNTGTGYVFFAKSKASWGSPTTSASADVTITGAAGDSFGFRWGAVGIGDVNGDGKTDCVLPATATGTVYGFSGATLAGSSSLTTAANKLFSQTGPPTFVDGSFWDAFGASAVSAFFTGAATQDLVIGDAWHNTTYLFTTAAAGLTQVTTLPGSGRFGWVVASADINKDGSPDLLVGRNDTSIGAVSIYLNTKVSPFFNQVPDATWSDAALANLALGISVTTGSYGGAANGLGIASGTAFNNVLIHYVNPPP
jgi:hypothetical protein